MRVGKGEVGSVWGGGKGEREGKRREGGRKRVF